MNRNEITDLLGRIVKVGDKVVIGKDWARDCNFLVMGTIDRIEYKPIKTIAYIKISNDGRCKYNKDTSIKNRGFYFSKYCVYEIPRSHNNLLIIN